MIASLEKDTHGYIENARDLRQATGADAVRSFLVLLDLLEGYPDAIAQLGL
jgi:hypothetical protein